MRAGLVFVLILLLALFAGCLEEVEVAPVVVEEVDAGLAMEHIRYISEKIGPRPCGLGSEKEAAEHIADYFEGLGYEVEIQEFEAPDQWTADVKINDAERWFGEWEYEEKYGAVWQAGANPLGPFTRAEGYVIDCGAGGKTKWPESVRGNIALVRSGLPTNMTAERAEESGAIGVILYGYSQPFNPYVIFPLDEDPFYRSPDIPMVGLALVHSEWLKEMAKEGVHVEIETKEHTNLTSQNVIAIRPGAREAPIAILGAHYDSVIGSPGANDDLSGVAVVMELARVFKDIETNYELRFVAWGAEERGLLGSRHYVSNLKDDEIERCVAYLNFDMVAASADDSLELNLRTVEGEPNSATDLVTAAAEKLGYTVSNEPSSGSDHVYFYDAGTPEVCFGSWPEPFYHTPSDTVENISAERLESALRLAAVSLYDLVAM